MIDVMLFLWIILFVVFFIAGMIEKSYTLGIVSGIILLIFALAIIITGVQVESGIDITTDESGATMEYVYTDMTLPFSTYSIVWGVILILLSVFIIYSNAENL